MSNQLSRLDRNIQYNNAVNFLNKMDKLVSKDTVSDHIGILNGKVVQQCSTPDGLKNLKETLLKALAVITDKAGDGTERRQLSDKLITQLNANHTKKGVKAFIDGINKNFFSSEGITSLDQFGVNEFSDDEIADAKKVSEAAWNEAHKDMSAVITERERKISKSSDEWVVVDLKLAENSSPEQVEKHIGLWKKRLDAATNSIDNVFSFAREEDVDRMYKIQREKGFDDFIEPSKESVFSCEDCMAKQYKNALKRLSKLRQAQRQCCDHALGKDPSMRAQVEAEMDRLSKDHFKKHPQDLKSLIELRKILQTIVRRESDSGPYLDVKTVNAGLDLSNLFMEGHSNEDTLGGEELLDVLFKLRCNVFDTFSECERELLDEAAKKN